MTLVHVGVKVEPQVLEWLRVEHGLMCDRVEPVAFDVFAGAFVKVARDLYIQARAERAKERELLALVGRGEVVA